MALLLALLLTARPPAEPGRPGRDPGPDPVPLYHGVLPPPPSPAAVDAVFEVVQEEWVRDQAHRTYASAFGRDEAWLVDWLQFGNYRTRRLAQLEILRSWPRHRRLMVWALKCGDTEAADFARWVLAAHGHGEGAGGKEE